MTDIQDKKDPQKEDNLQEDNSSDNKESNQDSSQEEQSKKQIDNQEDLPEKFKGKSASDIAKSYLELEKKLGSYSQTEKELQDWRQLGKVIKQDPELVKALEAKVAGEQKSEANGKANDDTRNALSNKIVGDFEKDYGIDRLSEDKRREMHKKIGEELADMLDPGGNKTTREILDSINLSRLPQYLGKAYRLATIDDEAEQNRAKGIIQARQNSEGTFSSMRSSGGQSQKTTLSPEEEATAKKLGISPEKYLEQKKKLN